MKKVNILLLICFVMTASYGFGMDDLAAGRRPSETAASEHKPIEQMGDRHEEELRELQERRLDAKRQVNRDTWQRARDVRAQVKSEKLTSDEGSLQLDAINNDARSKKDAIDIHYDNVEKSVRAGHARELSERDPVERSIHEKYVRDKAQAKAEYDAKDQQVTDTWDAQHTAISNRTDLEEAERDKKHARNDEYAEDNYAVNKAEHEARMKSLRDGYESDLAEARAKKAATEKMDAGFKDAVSGEAPVSKPVTREEAEQIKAQADEAGKKKIDDLKTPEQVREYLGLSGEPTREEVAEAIRRKGGENDNDMRGSNQQIKIGQAIQDHERVRSNWRRNVEVGAEDSALTEQAQRLTDLAVGEVAKPEEAASEKSFDDMDHAEKKAYIKKNLPESVTDALSAEELDTLLDFAADTAVDQQLVSSETLTPEQAVKLKGQIKEAMKKAEASVFKDPRLQEVLAKPEVREMFEQHQPASEQVQRVIKEAEQEYWNENASRLDKITKWAKNHKLLIAGLVTFVVLAIIGSASH